MGEFVVILLVLFLAFVALGVYAAVKVVRAASRGVERTVNQARRTVEDTALRAKSYGQGGAAAELAQLRLSLRTSMRATREALGAGAREDASLAESLALFERLSAHGHELDAELKRLEREPDRAALATQLPGLRERTERVTHAADSLRWAARDRAQRFAEDDLDLLSAQIDMEAGALRHWAVEEPSAPGAEPHPGQAPAQQDPARGPGRGEGAPAAGADRSGALSGDAPQAITARDPRAQTAYPWEKKTPRPETSG
ncbi:hypothetical protein NPS70_06555 [Streptomyces sp. C10-9-1]|uniref:hypothetical protein n=1 Tax=Streptomyces sp. C10-9-1 TaxID=1859285 RepID=UPI002112E935|nr:hypothetical protein [Streptomyces sp. C10-9-1]MCQ6552861.1 hypothetical protein [Streptomyces sp. C10-9-1]